MMFVLHKVCTQADGWAELIKMLNLKEGEYEMFLKSFKVTH